MQQCAEHVEYQLPNSHTRVSYLLDGIHCSDAGLQVTMASIRTDDGPQGMRNNFELAAAHLLPYDPVAKKHAVSGNKWGSAQISSVGGDDPKRVAVSGTTISKPKSSIGSTGVHLRYHTPEEYDSLMIKQKDELRAWCKNTQVGARTHKVTRKVQARMVKTPNQRLSTLVVQPRNKYHPLLLRNRRK